MLEEIGSTFVYDEETMLSFMDKMTWEEFIKIHHPYFPAQAQEHYYQTPAEFYQSFFTSSLNCSLDMDWNYLYRYDLRKNQDNTWEVVFTYVRQRLNTMTTIRVAVNQHNYWQLLFYIDACKQYNAKHW